MHAGHYIFTQIIRFLPRRQFWRILDKYDDRTLGWSFTHWNQLLVLMFGQFLGCGSLRELTDITAAHSKRSYNLGFGASAVVRNTLAKANMYRETRIFKEFASLLCLLHSKGESQRNSNFTDVSVLSIPQPSTSACPSFAGHSFAAQSLASKSIPRLTSSPRYLCSTESQMPKSVTARLWTRLNMNPMPATS